MDKLVEKEVTSKFRFHEFYCDHCGKYLGETEEDPSDSYYHSIGEYEIRMTIADSRLTKTGHLCDDCRIKLMDDIINKLKSDFNFKEEKLKMYPY